MRGKAQLTIRDQPSDRITPAYAGKRSGATEKQIAHKDHPRLCGEKFFRRRQKFARLGSPPPMRGKERFGVTFNSAHRITPAYAGKSV